jgi:hypothetical protein
MRGQDDGHVIPTAPPSRPVGRCDGFIIQPMQGSTRVQRVRTISPLRCSAKRAPVPRERHPLLNVSAPCPLWVQATQLPICGANTVTTCVRTVGSSRCIDLRAGLPSRAEPGTSTALCAARCLRSNVREHFRPPRTSHVRPRTPAASPQWSTLSLHRLPPRPYSGLLHRDAAMALRGHATRIGVVRITCLVSRAPALPRPLTSWIASTAASGARLPAGVVDLLQLEEHRSPQADAEGGVEDVGIFAVHAIDVGRGVLQLPPLWIPRSSSHPSYRPLSRGPC